MKNKLIFILSKNKNYFLLLLVRAFFNGLQWVGWSLAVLISQQVIVSLLGWQELRNIVVSISIAINEVVCSQLFSRIILWMDKKLNSTSIHSENNTQNNNLPTNNTSNNITIESESGRMEINGIYKSMIGCVASGIVFDFVDRAIGNIYSTSAMYQITLLMRCICVFVADRLVFHVVMEIMDRIEEQKWTFSNEISNIEGSSSAGMSAIAYNLATELASYICNQHIGTENEWFVGLFCIPFIALATSIGFLIGVGEAKLWNLLDRARIYSKLHNMITNMHVNSGK